MYHYLSNQIEEHGRDKKYGRMKEEMHYFAKNNFRLVGYSVYLTTQYNKKI